jgi:hypothetical protein
MLTSFEDLPEDIRSALAELAALNNISCAAVMSNYGMTNPEETLKHNLLKSNEILQKLLTDWNIEEKS